MSQVSVWPADGQTVLDDNGVLISAGTSVPWSDRIMGLIREGRLLTADPHAVSYTHLTLPTNREV